DLLVALAASTSSIVVPATPCTCINSAAARTIRLRVAAPREVSRGRDSGSGCGGTYSLYRCRHSLVAGLGKRPCRRLFERQDSGKGYGGRDDQIDRGRLVVARVRGEPGDD